MYFFFLFGFPLFSYPSVSFLDYGYVFLTGTRKAQHFATSMQDWAVLTALPSSSVEGSGLVTSLEVVTHSPLPLHDLWVMAAPWTAPHEVCPSHYQKATLGCFNLCVPQILIKFKFKSSVCYSQISWKFQIFCPSGFKDQQPKICSCLVSALLAQSGQVMFFADICRMLQTHFFLTFTIFFFSTHAVPSVCSVLTFIAQWPAVSVVDPAESVAIFVSFLPPDFQKNYALFE